MDRNIHKVFLECLDNIFFENVKGTFHFITFKQNENATFERSVNIPKQVNNIKKHPAKMF